MAQHHDIPRVSGGEEGCCVLQQSTPLPSLGAFFPATNPGSGQCWLQVASYVWQCGGMNPSFPFPPATEPQRHDGEGVEGRGKGKEGWRGRKSGREGKKGEDPNTEDWTWIGIRKRSGRPGGVDVLRARVGVMPAEPRAPCRKPNKEQMPSPLLLLSPFLVSLLQKCKLHSSAGRESSLPACAAGLGSNTCLCMEERSLCFSSLVP